MMQVQSPYRLVTIWTMTLTLTVGLRPYYGESTGSHPNSKVKHRQAPLVLRWGTTLEPGVLQAFGFSFCSPLAVMMMMMAVVLVGPGRGACALRCMCLRPFFLLVFLWW